MILDIGSLNSTAFQNLPDFVYFVINYAITFSVLIAVISLIIGGFKYILSAGDDKKRKEAINSLMYSLIGLVLVFVSPTVIEFVINTILNIK